MNALLPQSVKLVHDGVERLGVHFRQVDCCISLNVHFPHECDVVTSDNLQSEHDTLDALFCAVNAFVAFVENDVHHLVVSSQHAHNNASVVRDNFNCAVN